MEHRAHEGNGMNDHRTMLVERISEDEGLTGDLGGDAAVALRAWASDQATHEAQSAQLADAVVTQRIGMIRTVARAVAARASRESIDVVAEAQRQYALVRSAPDTTMAIRTGPMRVPSADRRTAKARWWQRLLFWRSAK
jgi:hypothetical protein